MPFTFAHPAILLPFRKYLSVTGLIIGCMSPDFEYFLRFRIYSTFSHTFLGTLFFCLPISIIISIIFHEIIRNSLIENAPNYFYSRTKKYINFNWINYLINNKAKVVISILIGIFSHIFWDSFTHENGFFVKEIKILQSTFVINQQDFHLLKILQHLSTFLGLIYIFYIFNNLCKNDNSIHKMNLKFYLSIVITTFILLFALIKFNSDTLKIGNLIATIISSTCISTLIICLIFKIKKQPF